MLAVNRIQILDGMQESEHVCPGSSMYNMHTCTNTRITKATQMTSFSYSKAPRFHFSFMRSANWSAPSKLDEAGAKDEGHRAGQPFKWRGPLMDR